MNHTITLNLPDTIYESLLRDANVCGKTPEEVLVENILPPISIENRKHDSFFADRVVFEGDAPADGSLIHDKYLYDERP